MFFFFFSLFVFFLFVFLFFFFQAEDGIRDRSPSRGLGDVYKRQHQDGMMKDCNMYQFVQPEDFGTQIKPLDLNISGISSSKILSSRVSVSYTHLTLPTKRIV